jgi:hypothetical protein
MLVCPHKSPIGRADQFHAPREEDEAFVTPLAERIGGALEPSLAETTATGFELITTYGFTCGGN